MSTTPDPLLFIYTGDIPMPVASADGYPESWVFEIEAMTERLRGTVWTREALAATHKAILPEGEKGVGRYYFRIIAGDLVPCGAGHDPHGDLMSLGAAVGQTGRSPLDLIALHDAAYADRKPDPRPPGRRGYKAAEFANDNPLTAWAAKLRRAGHGRYACRYTAILVALDCAVGLLCDARDRFSPDGGQPDRHLHDEACGRLHDAEKAVREAATLVTDYEARNAVLGRPMGCWPRRDRFDRKPKEGGQP